MAKSFAASAFKLAFLVVLAGATSGLLGATSAEAQRTAAATTYRVDRVKAPGRFPVAVQETDRMGRLLPPRIHLITVTRTSTPASVASDIAAAFGGSPAGFVTNEGTVAFVFTVLGNPPLNASFAGDPNNTVSFTLDTEESYAHLPAPSTPVADLGFLPNPSNGSDVLAANSVITAGFASGLPPVSFTAFAGEDLDQLASMLDTALMNGGYMTSMPDPTDIVVNAEGASTLPIEFDFSIDPLTTVGSAGDIGIELSSVAVPEPTSLALLVTGLGLIRRTGKAVAPRRRA
jgi:hypothetical protein